MGPKEGILRNYMQEWVVNGNMVNGNHKPASMEGSQAMGAPKNSYTDGGYTGPR